jgi:hypothetical protein
MLAKIPYSGPSVALENLFQKLSCKKGQETMEKILVYIALVTFIGHVILIFLTYTLPILPFESFLSPSYLSAISTPLSLILFYEVYLLVISLSQSIFFSILKQMEIVTLVIIRAVFKALETGSGTLSIFENWSTTSEIGLLFGGSLIAFLMVAIFKILVLRQSNRNNQETDHKLFLWFKNLLSLATLVVLAFLVAIDFLLWLLEISGIYTLNFDYLVTLFLLMIFLDIIVFLVSLLFTEDFGIIYIDSVFALVAIFLRFSIFMEPFSKVTTVTFTMIFSIVVLLIYTYLWKPGDKKT